MQVIPFTPSDNNVKLTVPVDSSQYVFYHRWNARENAWYLDLYQQDFTPILLGIKLVLGTYFGRNCADPFFETYSLSLIDTTNTGVDPGFDDLGDRVVLALNSITQFASFYQNGTDS